MKNSISIRKLSLDDLEQYKNIRLELLKNSPSNFGSSYEEESKFDRDMWVNRLTKKHISVFGAFDNDLIVGIVLAVMNPRKKIKHVATLNSMYVKEGYRNKGIGKDLIETAIRYLENEDVEIINLSVSEDNESAISLYKRLGFIVYGEEKKAIKLNGKYIDTYLMNKELF